jgi:septation ring formation regulator EzrA
MKRPSMQNIGDVEAWMDWAEERIGELESDVEQLEQGHEQDLDVIDELRDEIAALKDNP